MLQEDTLEIVGNKIPSDFPINMPGDWFMLGYLHETPSDAVSMMSPIANDLVIIKSYAGDVYWPLFDINSLSEKFN